MKNEEKKFKTEVGPQIRVERRGRDQSVKEHVQMTHGHRQHSGDELREGVRGGLPGGGQKGKKLGQL